MCHRPPPTGPVVTDGPPDQPNHPVPGHQSRSGEKHCPCHPGCPGRSGCPVHPGCPVCPGRPGCLGRPGCSGCPVCPGCLGRPGCLALSLRRHPHRRHAPMLVPGRPCPLSGLSPNKPCTQATSGSGCRPAHRSTAQPDADSPIPARPVLPAERPDIEPERPRPQVTSSPRPHPQGSPGQAHREGRSQQPRPPATGPSAAPPEMLLQTTLATAPDLHALRVQVRPGARGARRGDPAQRRPPCPHRHTAPPPVRTPHCHGSSRVPCRRQRSPVAAVIRTRSAHLGGALLGLRREDLNLAGGTASIRRTLQRTNSGGRTALPTKAQSSERRIALPTPRLRPLEQHHNQQRQEREAAGESWQDSGYIFARPNGAPIEGATLTRHFITLLHQAGPRRIRFHDLRHTTATLLLEQGVELVVIKELLGHAHIGVTATVYAHVRLRLQRDAIEPPRPRPPRLRRPTRRP
ncbi:tyrosine-type recombinase/integrase [Streptomyces sp. NPDC088249]|uniref:tyrosine-type recombinase/integrase n=2 Tax=unclassified Streptomyces TaxID=2593676 RepID=UPI0038016F39